MLIEAKHVRRAFGTRPALDGVDFSLEPGEIAVLAGPNGSGKTTLLKILAGLIRHDRGSVSVCGLAPFEERVAVMRHARFAFAPAAAYPRLTAREHLQRLCGLGLPRSRRPDAAAIAEVLERVGLASRADEPVRVFSFGMRQRLLLAMALLPRPRLLVLDEPTEGLDPPAIAAWRELLRSLRDDWGLGMVLASHWLHDMEHLADRLLVLRDGRSLFHGSPAVLMEPGRRAIIQFQNDRDEIISKLTESQQAAFTDRGWTATTQEKHWLIEGETVHLDSVQQVLGNLDLRLASFRSPTLAESLLNRLDKPEAWS